MFRRAIAFFLTAELLAANSSLVAADKNSPNPQGAAMESVVVHINFADTDRQKHGLKNIDHMLTASTKPLKVEVVAHGEGLDLLITKKTVASMEIKQLEKKGVRFVACENTMKSKQVTSDQLLEGVGTVPSGALEIVVKQNEGYAYFRP